MERRESNVGKRRVQRVTEMEVEIKNSAKRDGKKEKMEKKNSV